MEDASYCAQCVVGWSHGWPKLRLVKVGVCCYYRLPPKEKHMSQPCALCYSGKCNCSVGNWEEYEKNCPRTARDVLLSAER